MQLETPHSRVWSTNIWQGHQEHGGEEEWFPIKWFWWEWISISEMTLLILFTQHSTGNTFKTNVNANSKACRGEDRTAPLDFGVRRLVLIHPRNLGNKSKHTRTVVGICTRTDVSRQTCVQTHTHTQMSNSSKIVYAQQRKQHEMQTMAWETPCLWPFVSLFHMTANTKTMQGRGTQNKQPSLKVGSRPG